MATQEQNISTNVTKPLPPWYRQIGTIWRTLVVILTPLVFLPLPIIYTDDAAKCGYTILVMAVYWMTEVIPMAATALLPVVIFPWLSVMSTADVCQNYLKDSNMLFLGGLMVAVAVEKWNLHKRIALRTLLIVGARPLWLMFGFMAVTAFLSMWISNTATTAMMIPIAHAVLNELRPDAASANTNNNDETHDNQKIDKSTPTNHINGIKTPESYEVIVISSSPEEQRKIPNGEDSDSQQFESSTSEEREVDESDEYYERVGIGMRLSIAYAANIGGTGTLTGTGPNLVLKGQLDTIFKVNTGVNFSSWLAFGIPNMLISLFLAWLWLALLFIGLRQVKETFLCRGKKGNASIAAANAIIRSEYDKLGNISFAEVMVLIHFIVLVLLWFTREPGFFPGWLSLLPKAYVSDACVVITICIVLFVFPSRLPNYLCFRRKSDLGGFMAGSMACSYRSTSVSSWIGGSLRMTRALKTKVHSSVRSLNDTDEPGLAPALLDWPTVQKQVPWSVIILLGGGFALADGVEVSGLSKILGDFLVTFDALPPWALVFVLCTLTAIFTEVTSNVATATIILPVLAQLGKTIKINPLYLMIPVAVSTSFAFMLPVATPPNAIVFAYGRMRIIDMVKAGLVMNIVCLLVLQLAINTWGYALFDLGTFPEWAMPTPENNVTIVDNCTVFLQAMM